MLIKLENPVSGKAMLELCVTHHYDILFKREDVFGPEGIDRISGMTAVESMPILEYAAEILGNDTDPDYRKAVEGNAKLPVLRLLMMADMCPDGVWNVDRSDICDEQT